MPDLVEPDVAVAHEPKFAGYSLVLGTACSSDLKECLGLEDDYDFGELFKNPLKSMKDEFLKNGSERDIANFNYVTTGIARADGDIPQHVKETFLVGRYHGGTIVQADYDTGHDQMDLDDFVNHGTSRAAGLKRHHVVAVRMYTSDSYVLFNGPIRKGTKPHPIKFTMYMLDEALKKLRKVEAKADPEAYAQTLFLWRGMKDMHMDMEKFQKVGGTEVRTHAHAHAVTNAGTHAHTVTHTHNHTFVLTSMRVHKETHNCTYVYTYAHIHTQMAPMSTTVSREIANMYAQGRSGGMLFRFATKSRSKGVSIDYLSLYPKEKEFLYPPLTGLTYDADSEMTTEDGVIIVPILPQMS